VKTKENTMNLSKQSGDKELFSGVKTKENTIDLLLNNINENDISYFSFIGKTFIAKPCHIYDGDTFSIIFKYKDEYIKYRCRCMGYDCPEMKPLKSNPNRDNEKKLAIQSRNRLVELLSKHSSKLIKVECLEFDKYGRILINVWNMVDIKSINQIMIDEGHGKAYNGGTKEGWD
jgi:endonuclease YncB( thermonuclease family)